MWIPFISSRLSESSKRLERRKGGGGKGGGGRSSGGSRGGSGRSSGSSGSSSGRKSTPISTGGSSRSSKPNKVSTTYGRGGGSPAAIPAGQLFAGRIAGGGTRSQIFGNKMYGSGYPGVAGRGVAGRGFPFYFWPLAWGTATVGTATYLYTDEYGLPSNTSRPGGVMATATFQSSTSTNSTFRILADTSTVTDLISDLKANCSSSTSSISTSPSPFTDSPKPEQVIQYYRASSIALSLDGYNNTAVHAPEGTPDAPLPAGVDMKLMECLNQTIGLAAPLIDGANVRWAAPQMSLLGLAWVLWNIMSVF